MMTGATRCGKSTRSSRCRQRMTDVDAGRTSRNGANGTTRCAARGFFEGAVNYALR